jgi:hypothetical protein
MASPHQPDDPQASNATAAPPHESDQPDATGQPVRPDQPDRSDQADYDDYQPPRVLRLRILPWDLTCTVALLALLVYLATATNWPTRLFGYLSDVCVGDMCGPVPFGVDYYIHPVVWGGIGAAIAAAGIGPFISLLKGWYMSFWPVLALAVILVSSVAGYILTTFSERYWL